MSQEISFQQLIKTIFVYASMHIIDRRFLIFVGPQGDDLSGQAKGCFLKRNFENVAENLIAAGPDK